MSHSDNANQGADFKEPVAGNKKNNITVSCEHVAWSLAVGQSDLPTAKGNIHTMEQLEGAFLINLRDPFSRS